MSTPRTSSAPASARSTESSVAVFEGRRPGVRSDDLIQTLVGPELPGGRGSVGQVRGCAQQLVRRAKQLGVAVVVVGHVTKNGTLAGPRSLEHVVDTVLAFEG